MAISDKEAEAFRKDFVAWLKANAPKDPEFLLPQSFMEVGNDRQFAFLRDWQRKVYEAGYLGMAWPKAYGGRGLDQAFQDIATDEMEERRVPFMMNTIGLNWAGPLILDFGTDEMKRQYIKRILSAEDIWCQGFSEPDHGSDLASSQTRADRSGNEYVINGSKIWTTLGPYADHMILVARTSRDAPSKHAGLSFFLCPMKIDGITVQPIRKITGEYGFSQVFFNNARIPANALLGEEGRGWFFAMQTLSYERRVAGGQAGGHNSVYLTRSGDLIDMAKRARLEGKPAIDDPIVRDRIVQLMIDEMAMALTDKRRLIPPLIAERPDAIPMLSKLVWSEHRLRFSRFALELLGPDAALYVDDPGAFDGGRWARNYLNIFSQTIGGGASEIQRNIVAERILGLPKD